MPTANCICSKLYLLTCPTGWNLAFKMKYEEPMLNLMAPVSYSLHYVSSRNQRHSKTGDENAGRLQAFPKWLKKSRRFGLLDLKPQNDKSKGMDLIQITQQKLLRRSTKNFCLHSNNTRTKTSDEVEKQYAFTQFAINLWNWLSPNTSALKSPRVFETELTFYLHNENIHS